jgi:hypothetical protein
MKLTISLMFLLLMAAPGLQAADAPAAKTVDSGSFGIFLNGKRTATEKFTVEQSSEGSQITTDFKTEGTGGGTHQTTLLKLGPSSDLRHYEFKDIEPGTAQAVVEPKEEFLIQHSTLTPTDKPEEHQYILPPTTTVLDDFVFIHRELLTWRFLAIGCRQNNGQVQCPLKTKMSIDVVIPRSRTSMLVGVTFMGRDNVTVHGKPRELNRFDLTSETTDWQLWLDDDYKVVRMFIPDQTTEIVRD